MTHREFIQRVMAEWNRGPDGFRQSCYCQWYHYIIQIDGCKKIVGEYTLHNGRPAFVLTKQDGTEEVWYA